MALTIKFTPPAFSSTQDDLVFTVADAAKVDDPVSFPNFKFIGDVYIAGNLVARVKKVPDPVTGIGIFNIGMIVRNYAGALFNPSAGALVAQQLGEGLFSVTVTMHFGEEWNFTPTLDIVVDSARVFFNNYNGILVGNSSSLIGLADKVASNQPTTGKVFLSSGYSFLSYFPTSTTPVPVVITPTGGGTGFTTSFTPSSANALQIINVAPANLNALHAGTIAPGASSYTVAIGGQTYTYKIICEPIYQPFMIHFLNQYGGFDSKIFSKLSRQTLDIVRTNFGKLPFAVDSDGQVTFKNSNGVYGETQAVYSSLYTQKSALNSDLLTDAEYAWLADLLVSPLIYIENGGFFFSVTITDTTYEAKKTVNDDLTNLLINIQFGNQLNAQFR